MAAVFRLLSPASQAAVLRAAESLKNWGVLHAFVRCFTELNITEI